MKKFYLKYSWLPVLFLLSACWKEPDFPDEPEIKFNYITQRPISDNFGNKVVEIQIAVKFQDGNGDLGLDPNELANPYDYRDGNNKFFNNYFVDAFVERNGEFEPYVPAILYNGRFLPLNPDGKTRALEGELRYTFNIFPGFDLNPGDRLKFRIQIADRARNLSAPVETEPIQLNF